VFLCESQDIRVPTQPVRSLAHRFHLRNCIWGLQYFNPANFFAARPSL